MVKDCHNKEVVLSTYFVFSLKICKWIVKETDFKIIFIWIRLKRQHLSRKTQSIFGTLRWSKIYFEMCPTEFFVTDSDSLVLSVINFLINYSSHGPPDPKSNITSQSALGELLCFNLFLLHLEF